MSSEQGIPAVILAGGLGSRLRSVSGDLPKSMMPIAGRPFLEHLLRHLRRQGVDRVVLCVGYGADRIREHFASGQALGLDLAYSEETELLGTAGALKLGSAMVEDDIFVALNGDSFIEVSLLDLVAAHRTRNASMSVTLTRVPDAARFGDVDWDERSGLIRRFTEKGRSGASLVNAGVYIVSRDVTSEIPPGVVSLERDVLPLLAGNRVYGFVAQGLFVDIGLPHEYRRLVEYPHEFLAAIERIAA